MTTFAVRLKAAMSNANMKAVDLHEKTGISKSTISEYLSGNYEPKQKNIYKLATALNIMPSDLMGIGEEDTASRSSLPQHIEQMVEAYKAAPLNIQGVVDFTLKDYWPQTVKEPTLEEKFQRIAGLLSKNTDIYVARSKTDGFKDGEYVAFALFPIPVIDGYVDFSNIPGGLRLMTVEKMYEALLPAMEATGAEKENLLRDFYRSSFGLEFAIEEGTGLITDNIKLVPKAKSRVLEERQRKLEPPALPLAKKSKEA